MNTPLVTVGVVTYNSADFIEETLNSIYNQDYQNIELIVSDDCSTDNTIELCKAWISIHESRFNGAKLVTTDKNTGVSGNSNRALNEAHGEWYKCFDGDDILLPNAISSLMDYVINNPEVNHIVTQNPISDDTGYMKTRERNLQLVKYMCGPTISVDYQYYVISKMLFFSCVTYFAKTSEVRKVGGFDERFPMIEDYPLAIKMIGAGNKLYYLDIVTVKYRVRNDSISHSQVDNAIIASNAVKYIVDYKLLYKYENNNSVWKALLKFSLILSKLVIVTGNKKDNILSQTFYRLSRLLDPFAWFMRMMFFKSSRAINASKFKNQ